MPDPILVDGHAEVHTWRLNSEVVAVVEPLLKAEVVAMEREDVAGRFGPSVHGYKPWDRRRAVTMFMDLYETFHRGTKPAPVDIASSAPQQLYDVFRMGCSMGLGDFTKWLYDLALAPVASLFAGVHDGIRSYRQQAIVQGFQYAVLGGHVQVVQWMVDEHVIGPCEWNGWAGKMAALLPSTAMADFLASREK